jgi:hypothetical protein
LYRTGQFYWFLVYSRKILKTQILTFPFITNKNLSTHPLLNFIINTVGAPNLSVYRVRTVPYRTVPYRTVPYRTVPYRTVPYRTVPYHTVPYRTVPYRTVPYRTVPYRTVPYRTVPYRTVPYRFPRGTVLVDRTAYRTFLTVFRGFLLKSANSTAI